LINLVYGYRNVKKINVELVLNLTKQNLIILIKNNWNFGIEFHNEIKIQPHFLFFYYAWAELLGILVPHVFFFLFFHLYLLRILCFNLKIYFIHVSVLKFKWREKKKFWKIITEKKLLFDYISLTKNINFGVNRFYLKK
jgi:hypothetical protein